MVEDKESEAIRYRIPIRTISEANARGHWAKNNKLHKDQKMLARTYTVNALSHLSLSHPLRQPNAQIDILMVRRSPKFLDSDNLVSAFKRIRDIIADVLNPGHRPGMADGANRLAWMYNQEYSKEYEVDITLSIYDPDLTVSRAGYALRRRKELP